MPGVTRQFSRPAPKGHKDESVIVFPRRNGLQRKHFPPLLRADGYPVTDRATQYLPHRVFVSLIQSQVAVFVISLQESPLAPEIRQPRG